MEEVKSTVLQERWNLISEYNMGTQESVVWITVKTLHKATSYLFCYIYMVVSGQGIDGLLGYQFHTPCTTK